MKHKSTYLHCDCGCGVVEFEKASYDQSDELIYTDYTLSFQNSRLVSEHNTVFQRMRDAAKVLFGKPIYYADAMTMNKKMILDFLQSSIDIVNEN
jgi:hypothetical protein